jgi:hypothetical protein
LQLAIDRALLGGQQSNASLPSNLDVKVKPFPWPAKQEDIGAASAAVLLNLLLVYAFMAPTRGVVGSIVREKELRLREGMRILGLSVRCSNLQSYLFLQLATAKFWYAVHSIVGVMSVIA